MCNSLLHLCLHKMEMLSRNKTCWSSKTRISRTKKIRCLVYEAHGYLCIFKLSPRICCAFVFCRGAGGRPQSNCCASFRGLSLHKCTEYELFYIVHILGEHISTVSKHCHISTIEILRLLVHANSLGGTMINCRSKQGEGFLVF